MGDTSRLSNSCSSPANAFQSCVIIYPLLASLPLRPLPLRRLLIPPDVPHSLVLGREFRRVVHESWHGITDAILVCALQSLYDFIKLRCWDRERHLVVLGLAKHAIPSAGQDHLAFVGLHGPHNDVRTVQPATKGGREIPTAFV